VFAFNYTCRYTERLNGLQDWLECNIQQSEFKWELCHLPQMWQKTIKDLFNKSSGMDGIKCIPASDAKFNFSEGDLEMQNSYKHRNLRKQSNSAAQLKIPSSVVNCYT